MKKHIYILGLSLTLSTALSAQESSVEFYDNTGTNVKASTGYKEDNGGRYHITTEGVERIKVIKDSLDVSGSVKANKYYGDGSGLTGIKVEGPTTTDVANQLKADNAFLNSVKGPKGDSGARGANGTSPTSSAVANTLKADAAFLTAVKGDKGDQGAKGDSGARGDQGPEGPKGSFDPNANISMDSLHVKKDVRVDGSLSLQGVNNFSWTYTMQANKQFGLEFNTGNPQGSPIVFDGKGNVGLGSSLRSGQSGYDHKLQVAGTITYYGAGLNGSEMERMVLFSDKNNHTLFEAPSQVEGAGQKLNYYFSWRGDGVGGSALTILGANKNVGIGTTNPLHKLHVVGNIYATGTITPSDSRYKTNITPIDSSLLKILALKGVYYNWDIAKWPSKNFSDKKQIGLIAQEVEKIIPEVVNTDKEGYKSLSYDKLTAVLINALEDLKMESDSKIDSLKNENDVLQKTQSSILARLEALEKSKK